MTREFIFRAWDKLENKMYYNVGLTKYGVQIYTDDEKFPETILLERGRDCFEVMEYTGLKDKNGRLIFEGDILRFRRIFDPQFYGDYRIGRVKWEESRFAIFSEGWDSFLKQNYTEFSFFEPRILDHCEMIGNIHDNPELLKGGGV